MRRWWRRRARFPEPSLPPVVPPVGSEERQVVRRRVVDGLRSELERIRQERIDVLLDLFEEDIDEELADRAAAASPDHEDDGDGEVGDVIVFDGWRPRG